MIWRLRFVPVAFLTVLAGSVSVFGQGQKKAAAPAGSEVQRAVGLAESGNCNQALPLLKKLIRQATDKELKKRMALDGVHCAMTHNAPYEALELQNKWDEAAAEYRKILEINPLLAGMHARLGRALLSKPQPSPTDVAQAKKDFEQELQIDPNNTVAEYVLGDLASRDNDLPAGIRHFAKATKLDPSFAEAYLGLGTALVSSKRFEEAIAPLETYEKLAPDSPTGHYQLALAYAGVGRKDDANREAALQRQTAESLEQVKRKVAEGLEQQKSPAPPNTEAPQ